MKKILLLAFVLIINSSCQESKETSFDKYGVSFICPKGWRIVEEEPLEDDYGYYLAIEKEGFDSSGLVVVMWLEDIIVHEEVIDMQIDELKAQMTHKNLKPGYITSGDFNDFKSQVLEFSFSLLGIPHDGKIYCFQNDQRTYLIFMQEALEDNGVNKEGFEVIEKSFQIR